MTTDLKWHSGWAQVGLDIERGIVYVHSIILRQILGYPRSKFFSLVESIKIGHTQNLVELEAYFDFMFLYYLIIPLIIKHIIFTPNL